MFMARCLLILSLSSTFLWPVWSETEISTSSRLHPCTSYLSHDSNIGCTSHIRGTSGEVYYIKSANDLSALKQKPGNQKYTVVITPDQFTSGNIKDLEKANKIAGVVVLLSSDSTRPESQSFDSKYLEKPEGQSKVEWNPLGQDMMNVKYSFPMVLLKDKSLINKIKECYEARNSANLFPKCGIRFQTHMAGYSMTTPQCRHKTELSQPLWDTSFCFELSSQNVYALLGLITSPPKKFIVIATKLDIRCLFRGACIGAESELSGLVVFLYMIQLMSESITKIAGQTDYQILFAGFDGESWDHIGSSNFAHHISTSSFTKFRGLDAKKIAYWIELGPLGMYNQKYYLHKKPKSGTATTSSSDTETDKLANNIKTKLSAKNVESEFVWTTLSSQPLPHSALKQIHAHEIDVPGVYFGDFKTGIPNKFYHGIFDDLKNLGIDLSNKATDQIIKRLADTSAALAETVFELINVTPDTKVQPSVENLAKLIECFMVKSNCELLKQILAEKNAKDYLSENTFVRETNDYRSTNPYIQSIMAFIGFHIGSKLSLSDENCKYRNKSLLAFNSTQNCVVNASVYLASESSLYFKNPDLYSNYSSWVISNFEEPTIVLYYFLDSVQSTSNLIIGILVSALFIMLTIIVRTKPEIFFNE